MNESEVPAETEQEIERLGRGVAGKLQAEEIVGFWQTLVEGGLPEELAQAALVIWMTPTPGEGGCCLHDEVEVE